MMYGYESDLNRLKYHPYHGTLCRRLLNFIEESTLWIKDYPNVYAEEEYHDATEELRKSEEELEETSRSLVSHVDNSEDRERERTFLRSRLKCVHTTHDLLTSSIEILKGIIDRPTLAFEQLGEKCDDTGYLSDPTLIQMYPPLGYKEWEINPSRRQITQIEDEIEATRISINEIHQTLKDLISIIDGPLEEYTKQDLSIKHVPIERLEAIKVPPVEELVVEEIPGAGKLKEINNERKERVCKLDEEVCELRLRFQSKRQQIIEMRKEELLKSTNAIKSMIEIDNILQQGQGSSSAL